MKIVIVDYGMGNIKSIIGALQFVGIDDVVVSYEYNKLKKADKLILPGVGSFGQAMQTIKNMHLDEFLDEVVLNDRKPILGICLGMQLMGMSSSEQGNYNGLGYVKGVVTRLSDQCQKIPHAGFNQVRIDSNLKLYQGMNGCPDFYFTHSYKMKTNSSINQCFCDYGEDFIASFEVDHIAGVQFHPELSQYNGLQLIKNFVEQF